MTLKLNFVAIGQVKFIISLGDGRKAANAKEFCDFSQKRLTAPQHRPIISTCRFWMLPFDEGGKEKRKWGIWRKALTGKKKEGKISPCRRRAEPKTKKLKRENLRDFFASAGVNRGRNVLSHS